MCIQICFHINILLCMWRNTNRFHEAQDLSLNNSTSANTNMPLIDTG